MDEEVASLRFLDWMHRRVVSEARGDAVATMEVEPRGSLWLGRLASEDTVAASPLGKRAEKIDPCAVGFRVRPEEVGPWNLSLVASFVCWVRIAKGHYEKLGPFVLAGEIAVPTAAGTYSLQSSEVRDQLDAAGLPTHGAEVRVEVEDWRDVPELVITLVNTGGGQEKQGPDTNIYEAQLTLLGLKTRPFQLESLPDSFRYDRNIDAIGINGGVLVSAGTIATTDAVVAQQFRPSFWNMDSPAPDFSFVAMGRDPLPQVQALLDDLKSWGSAHWSPKALDAQGQGWPSEMRLEADAAALEFQVEVNRLEAGLALLGSNPALLKAFSLASLAVGHAADGKYSGWRPFQVGFLVSALAGLVDEDDADTVDVVWFATGGGKTETYLGLLVTAILYDRLTGKSAGITAWSRFPLRMLSLQQTQRFADVLAGAEIERVREHIPGDPVSLGFFVGEGGTPNRIELEPGAGKPDAADGTMPGRFQVLLHCPFCRNSNLEMRFVRSNWTLAHCCPNPGCSWAEDALPFYVIDQEIFRFLPSVVIGTLDKAASLGMQTGMRGFFGAPHGVCDRPGHGYCYAPRKAAPTGCLVPGCRGSRVPIDQDAHWAPRLRLQDELHLLRDSLGAVDSHYEALLDSLQHTQGGPKQKIVASSATLSGYRRQIEVLYQRRGRVFPQPGPRVEESFWSQPGPQPSRLYVGLSPRGVTMEFVSDRTLTVLQACVRELDSNPTEVCTRLGIDLGLADHLVKQYGVNVVYGNRVADVEASLRSAETQFPFAVNAQGLTGSTPFEEVRKALARLEHPETAFEERIHLIAASSMIAHGVDVDRLNSMVMLGLPLTTAEFIQASARIGRKWPGVVYVVHRITREREVATFAQFQKFVTQGDRFIEPIPITRASRRVLALTLPGIQEARRLGTYEPEAGTSLSIVPLLRSYFSSKGVSASGEAADVIAALGLTGPLDELPRSDVLDWEAQYFAALFDPATSSLFPNQLSPGAGPMRSLRDVEVAIPIQGED